MTEITFKDLGLSKDILDSIDKKGYTSPSPIQAGVIPLALNTEKDIIGQAQTGSGKTAAFGLPILDRINNNSKDLEAIILTPTRELAIQVAEEIKSFATKSTKITLLYGGQNYRTEMQDLKNNPKIVVGTPGRIIDHLNKKRLILDNIKYFVLDEADEMLNIGFREEIEEILKFSPKEKKVFLFSATMPQFIMEIVKNYMKDYEIVSIKKEENTSPKITQIYYEAPRFNKLDVLSRLLDVSTDFYGIIFCKTKIETDEIASKLSQRGYLAEPIHGDIEQSMREKVLSRFKNKFTTVLVATDVAARGIDVNDLTHVVNYELPDNPETYTHRIGRTGRAGKTGIAVSIVSQSDLRKLSFIERVNKIKIKKSELPNGAEVITHKKNRLIQDIDNIILSGENNYIELADELLNNKNANVVLSALLKKFYKDEFNIDNYKNFNLNFSSTFQKSSKRDDGMVRLFIAKGKMDGFNNPGQLLSYVARESNLGDLGAGKVDILTNFSYADFPEDIAKIVLKESKDKNPSKPVIVKAKEKNGNDRNRKSFHSKRSFSNPRDYRGKYTKKSGERRK